MAIPISASQPGPGEPGGMFRAELATDPSSARQTRATVRQVLAVWGIDDPSGDAELLAPELVVNAAEHGDGHPISLALRRHAEPVSRSGIACEVTGTSPAMPRRTESTPVAERGRSLRSSPRLASFSGIRPETSWFTLALTDPAHQAARPIEHEPEAGARAREPKEDPTMPQSANDPDEQRRASAAARRAITDLARGRGAELISRPAFRGSDITVRDLDPLTGARTARDIEVNARGAARDYIRAAREAGQSWDQIGQALGVTPNADADQAGLTVAEAAYTYAAGNPRTDTAVRYGRSFVWRCRACDQAIGDRGLIAGPADDEPGHADGCPRLANAVAVWNAGLDADMEAER